MAVAEELVPIFRVDDARAAVAWYQRLGFELIVVSFVVAVVLLPPLLTWGERPAAASDAGGDQQPPAATASTVPSRPARATSGAS